MTLIPNGPQALRHLAETLEQQARVYDLRLWRDRGQRSTVAETFRHSASIARQQARRLEWLEEQDKASRAGKGASHQSTRRSESECGDER